MYKLRDWIDEERLFDSDIGHFCCNTHIVVSDIIEKDYVKLNFNGLCANEGAISLIDKLLFRDRLDFLEINKTFQKIKLIDIMENHNNIRLWDCLSCNPAAISFLEANLHNVNWDYFSGNKAAMHLLNKNLNKINWTFLSKNPAAIFLLEKYPYNIDWTFLSMNPAAIHLLEKNLNKIDWSCLSLNPAAIHLLEKNLNKIDWSNLCLNPSAMKLLEENQEKIDWSILSGNSEIFVCDYLKMKESKALLHENIIVKMFHPRNIKKFEGWGFL